MLKRSGYTLAILRKLARAPGAYHATLMPKWPA